MGVLIIGILLFRVLYKGPLLSETPTFGLLDKIQAGIGPLLSATSDNFT